MNFVKEIIKNSNTFKMKYKDFNIKDEKVLLFACGLSIFARSS